MNTDGRGLLREANFPIPLHPWISVFIRVQPCGTEAASTAPRGTRMDTDKRRGWTRMVGVCFAMQTFLSLFIRGYPCHPGKALRHRSRFNSAKRNTDGHG